MRCSSPNWVTIDVAGECTVELVGSFRFLFVLAALCCAASAQAAVLNTGPYFVRNGRFVTKPMGLIDLSGTDSYEIGSSRWTSWTARSATARTTYYVNLCKPNCARGRYASRPARVRFFRTASCRGRAVFVNYVVSALDGKALASGDFRSIGYLYGC